MAGTAKFIGQGMVRQPERAGNHPDQHFRRDGIIILGIIIAATVAATEILLAFLFLGFIRPFPDILAHLAQLPSIRMESGKATEQAQDAEYACSSAHGRPLLDSESN